ncbi:MAG: dTMP kinase [Myxococcota bacterium]|jgi:dTMP kinase
MGNTLRGKFIVIEGIDGAGTTTQAALLRDHLVSSGVRTHLTREPSDGPAGRLIREVLAGRTRAGTPFDRRALALLFAADRLDHISCEVEPMLASGVNVISDRYTLSSIAYQSQDAAVSWIRSVNRHAPTPDLYAFLDIPAKIGDERIGSTRSSRDIFEEIGFQERVAAAYRLALGSVPKSRLLIVDGTLPREEVFLAISRRVDRFKLGNDRRDHG